MSNDTQDNLGADAALIDALRGEAYVRKSNLIDRAADRLEALKDQLSAALEDRSGWKEQYAARGDQLRKAEALGENWRNDSREETEARIKAEATLAKVRSWVDSPETSFVELKAILDGDAS